MSLNRNTHKTKLYTDKLLNGVKRLNWRSVFLIFIYANSVLTMNLQDIITKIVRINCTKYFNYDLRAHHIWCMPSHQNFNHTCESFKLQFHFHIKVDRKLSNHTKNYYRNCSLKQKWTKTFCNQALLANIFYHKQGNISFRFLLQNKNSSKYGRWLVSVDNESNYFANSWTT